MFKKILILLIVTLLVITGILILKPKENNTLSDTDIKKFLSYVPNTYFYNAYKNANSYIEQVDNEVLLAMALGNISKKCGNISFEEMENNSCLNKPISKEEATKVLHQMYNKDFPELKDEEVQVAIYSYYCYNYNNPYFTIDACNTSNYENLSKVKNYEINNNNLIIYEYAAYLIKEEETLIRDYQTNNEVKGDNFSDNYNKFTLYKHTFIKNSDGYNWVSTEIA